MFLGPPSSPFLKPNLHLTCILRWPLRGKKNLTVMHHRLLFISSHYNLGLYFKSQLVKSAIYPLTPTTAILKVLLSKGLHKASHLPSLTILMHLRYCSQVHLSDSMTLITKLPDSVIQWYSQCLQNKVQKSLEVLMEENKLLAHLPNVL